jgi:hypothetical protein
MTKGVDFVVTLDPNSQRTRNIVTSFSKQPSESCDVVLAAWVYDSIVAGELQPLYFEYLVFACNETKGEIIILQYFFFLF